MDAKPWLSYYDPWVPPTLAPYPDTTLADIVAKTAHDDPQHTALIFKGRRISYALLDRLSNAFAAALIEQGVVKGERVALLLPNCPQAFIALLGAWKAGAIVNPINPLYTDRELEIALHETTPRAVVVLTRFYPRLKALQAATGVRTIIATNIKEYLPWRLRLAFTLAKEKKEGHRIHLAPGDLWLADLLRRHAGMPRPAVPVGPADPAVLLFTGGTTGAPKAALGSHRALAITGAQLYAWFSGVVQAGDVILCNMPIFHVFGLVGIGATAFVARLTIAVVPDPRDLDDVLTTVEKEHVAFLPGVPTLFNALLTHPRVVSGQANLRSVKLCCCGAAPLLVDTKRRFEALTGGHIIEGYGATETMQASIITPIQGLNKPGSTGLPLPDMLVKIVDADDDTRPLPPGATGEILVQAPNLMTAYWQHPEETEATLHDGWLRTGDLGYLDQDGFLFVVDRKKDVIKPSGFQVWPREVEEVIASHPAVAEVGVAGVPDPRSGEAVKAWVVLKPGISLSAAELVAYCHARLAGYKVPHHVEFVDSLPKSQVGKVLRRELVAREKERAVAVPGLDPQGLAPAGPSA